MKLKAEVTAYSSTVGGGLTLVDEQGRPRFMVMLIGTTDGITKEQDRAISEAIAKAVNSDGIEVPHD